MPDTTRARPDTEGPVLERLRSLPPEVNALVERQRSVGAQVHLALRFLDDLVTEAIEVDAALERTVDELVDASIERGAPIPVVDETTRVIDEALGRKRFREIMLTLGSIPRRYNDDHVDPAYMARLRDDFDLPISVADGDGGATMAP